MLRQHQTAAADRVVARAIELVSMPRELGDYVIVHVGYALNKLDLEEAARTLALFAELGQLDGDSPLH